MSKIIERGTVLKTCKQTLTKEQQEQVKQNLNIRESGGGAGLNVIVSHLSSWSANMELKRFVSKSEAAEWIGITEDELDILTSTEIDGAVLFVFEWRDGKDIRYMTSCVVRELEGSNIRMSATYPNYAAAPYIARVANEYLVGIVTP